MLAEAIEFQALTLPAIEFQAEEQRKQLQYTLANFAVIRFRRAVESRYAK